MRRFVLFFFAWIFFLKIFSQAAPGPYFQAPVEIQMLLSGNFGELRSNHFHSGIDIKTQGVEGFKILAAADGFVSRISVSAFGYGNSLYIEHPNGETTVYGHLQSFTSEIGAFVEEIQYKKQKFRVNAYLPPNRFPVKKGDLIALSGNSGSSGGPHLHFEIRKTDSQKPVNPLLYGFNIVDTRPPRIHKLVIYPLCKKTRVGMYAAPLYIPVQNGKIQYFTEVYGNVGIGVSANDYLNGTHNKCGIYEFELRKNDSLIFRSVMDGFMFNQTRYLNAFTDYRAKQRSHIWVHRLYKLPGNQLDIYKVLQNNGVVQVSEGDTAKMELVLTDVHGNSTALNFSLVGRATSTYSPTDYTIGKEQLMAFNRTNYFFSDSVSLVVPENALYEDLHFSFNKTNHSKGRVYELHTNDVPLHNKALLKIRLPDTLVLPQRNYYIARVSRYGLSYVASQFVNGYLQCKIGSFGSFTVATDTVPPKLRTYKFKRGSVVTNGQNIRFKISDMQSGIRTYSGFVNNNWALFKYDAKNSIIWYEVDKKRINKGRNELRIEVVDNCGNMSSYTGWFVF